MASAERRPSRSGQGSWPRRCRIAGPLGSGPEPSPPWRFRSPLQRIAPAASRPPLTGRSLNPDRSPSAGASEGGRWPGLPPPGPWTPPRENCPGCAGRDSPAPPPPGGQPQRVSIGHGAPWGRERRVLSRVKVAPAAARGDWGSFWNHPATLSRSTACSEAEISADPGFPPACPLAPATSLPHRTLRSGRPGSALLLPAD